jgi:hypothetical protein
MASPVIQFKRGAFANLPGLQAGEPALTTDTYELYVGINSTTEGNKFFGSHRYWTRETSSVGSRVNLVEGTSNGSDFVSLKSPDSLAGIVTFTMPGSDGSNGDILTTDGSGNLTFAAPAASSFTLAADVGSNDTFNTGETLTFTGGTGIEATVSNNQISYGLDAQLVDIAGLTPTDGGIIIGDGSNFVVESGATARASLGVDAAGTDNSTDVTLVTTAADYLSISGQAITLGLIDLTADVSGTLPLANGGIGATTAAGGRTNLGLVIGTDVQAYDAQLADIAGLTPTDSVFIVGDGSNFVAESGATARASLGLTIGTDVQAYDAELAALASVTSAANKLPYFTGSGTADVTDLSSFGRTLIDDADAAAARATLGVDASGIDNSTDVTLAGSYDYLTLSGQEITLGQVDLSTDVTGTLTTTTVNVTNVKANDGTAAITITDSTGAVEMSQNLTVQGNLIVNGSTTQVNTTQTTIEDQLLELGMVDGSAPSSDLNKDIGMLFNYYTSSAKKAGVYWDDSAARIAVASDVSETSGVLTASAYAALEIGSLWVNDCAGQSQVINCSGSERTLENITVDGGTF